MLSMRDWMIGTAGALVGSAIAYWPTDGRAADYSPPCVPPPQCYATAPATLANVVPQCVNPPGPLCATPAPPPPPVVQAVPVPVPIAEEFSNNWYLRGDIGVSSQRVDHLFNVLYNQAGTNVTPVGQQFDSAGFVGVGVGWQFNNWLRFDVTGEYRARANFKGSDKVTFPDGGGTAILSDNYTASKSEIVVLANAYLDLGTFWCITPFVGAGVGFANVTMSGFRDDGLGFFSDGTPFHSVAYAGTASQWNFAYATYAGLSYKVTPGFTVEVAYRYLRLGDGTTGDLVSFDGTNNVNNPMQFKGLSSHDFKVGFRWALDANLLTQGPAPAFQAAPATYVPPPQPQQRLYVPPVTSAPPVYQQPSYQPPSYQQPSYPLTRRG